MTVKASYGAVSCPLAVCHAIALHTLLCRSLLELQYRPVSILSLKMLQLPRQLHAACSTHHLVSCALQHVLVLQPYAASLLYIAVACCLRCVQRCWSTQPSYDCGMYIKESVVHSARLTPMPEGK